MRAWICCRATVVRFRGDYKVPHMGWNQLTFKQKKVRCSKGLKKAMCISSTPSMRSRSRQSDLLATTDYYQPVTAIVGRDNVYGMQFHPEKSGEAWHAAAGQFS